MEIRPFQIRMAERVVEIHPMHDEIRSLCQSYILSTCVVPDMTVLVSPQDIDLERNAAQREERKHGGDASFSDEYLETTAVYRKIATAMPAFDTILMHGTVVSSQRQGYMIVAPSGVGKTTRAKLWLEEIPDSFVVNGDKPLLRIGKDRVWAYGTPWCGKEGWNANTSVPLRAIFILERSDCGNRVQERGFGEAFPALLRQTFRPSDSQARRLTLSLLKTMAGKVKVYHFCSEPTVEAVRLAWETAREET